MVTGRKLIWNQSHHHERWMTNQPSHLDHHLIDSAVNRSNYDNRMKVVTCTYIRDNDKIIIM